MLSIRTNRVGSVEPQSVGDGRHAVTDRTFDGVRVVGCDCLDSTVDDRMRYRLRYLALTERTLNDAYSQSVSLNAVASGHSWRWDVELGPSSSSMPPSWAKV